MQKLLSNKKNLKIKCFSSQPEEYSAKDLNREIKPVYENIYLGSYDDTKDINKLEKAGIKKIINCSPLNCYNLYEQKFEYLNLEMEDNQSFEANNMFEKAAKFINDSTRQIKTNIFIHCFQGISRAPSLLIAYLIISKKFSLEQSLEKIKEQYPIAEPNLGFLIQLSLLYENKF